MNAIYLDVYKCFTCIYSKCAAVLGVCYCSAPVLKYMQTAIVKTFPNLLNTWYNVPQIYTLGGAYRTNNMFNVKQIVVYETANKSYSSLYKTMVFILWVPTCSTTRIIHIGMRVCTHCQ